MLISLGAGALSSFATESPLTSNNEVPSYSQATARVLYNGRAYSAAQNGLIPSSDGSVSVYWTDEDCSVEGNSGYQVYKISGGTFTMRVNGKVRTMTHYVNYGGERYFFCI